jgi:hypothetical protein
MLMGALQVFSFIHSFIHSFFMQTLVPITSEHKNFSPTEKKEKKKKRKNSLERICDS